MSSWAILAGLLAVSRRHIITAKRQLTIMASGPMSLWLHNASPDKTGLSSIYFWKCLSEEALSCEVLRNVRVIRYASILVNI
jgi:hypothetical protein